MKGLFERTTMNERIERTTVTERAYVERPDEWGLRVRYRDDIDNYDVAGEIYEIYMPSIEAAHVLSGSLVYDPDVHWVQMLRNGEVFGGRGGRLLPGRDYEVDRPADVALLNPARAMLSAIKGKGKNKRR